MRICDLKQKEVINVKDCKRLGYVCDIEFDCKNGYIIELIVPGTGKICGLFGRDTEFHFAKCVRLDQILFWLILKMVKNQLGTKKNKRTQKNKRKGKSHRKQFRKNLTAYAFLFYNNSIKGMLADSRNGGSNEVSVLRRRYNKSN